MLLNRCEQRLWNISARRLCVHSFSGLSLLRPCAPKCFCAALTSFQVAPVGYTCALFTVRLINMVKMTPFAAGDCWVSECMKHTDVRSVVACSRNDECAVRGCVTVKQYESILSCRCITSGLCSLKQTCDVLISFLQHVYVGAFPKIRLVFSVNALPWRGTILQTFVCISPSPVQGILWPMSIGDHSCDLDSLHWVYFTQRKIYDIWRKSKFSVSNPSVVYTFKNPYTINSLCVFLTSLLASHEVWAEAVTK